VKRTAWYWITTQLFLLPFLPQARTSASQKDEASPQRFVCDTGYTLERCNQDMAVLRAELAKYPVTQLGNWTWVLVRSQDWKAILLPRGLNPDSPAFSYLEKRVTFIEEALVKEVPVRRRELLLKWRMTIGELLDLSIAHELAHGLCGEKDEAKTIEVAKSLLDGKSPSCGVDLEAKIRAGKIRKTR
jgi:hypothetical protein